MSGRPVKRAFGIVDMRERPVERAFDRAGIHERPVELGFCLVGLPRFELGTSCTPSNKYQSLTGHVY